MATMLLENTYWVSSICDNDHDLYYVYNVSQLHIYPSQHPDNIPKKLECALAFGELSMLYET